MSVTVRTVSDRVGVVAFAQDHQNRLNAALTGAIADALWSCADLRAVVLVGEGRHFSAGADLDELRSGDPAARAGIYEHALRIASLPIPVVAAVRGAAVGAGLGLALTADFRVCTPDARFVANFALLGLHPGFGITLTLPRLVGPQGSARMLLTGRGVSADEALGLGLVDEIADGDLLAAALDRAEEIAAAAPLAVRSIRETLRANLMRDFADVLAGEQEAQTRLVDTDDFREGVASAMERRTPDFSGH